MGGSASGSCCRDTKLSASCTAVHLRSLRSSLQICCPSAVDGIGIVWRSIAAVAMFWLALVKTGG
jgi:hypothetical protein